MTVILNSKFPTEKTLIYRLYFIVNNKFYISVDSNSTETDFLRLVYFVYGLQHFYLYLMLNSNTSTSGFCATQCEQCIPKTSISDSFVQAESSLQ